MSLSVPIDAVLRLDTPVTPEGKRLFEAVGYTNLKSARNAVSKGTFPIRQIPGIGAVRFTLADVQAFTQRGQVTNEKLVARLGPKRRRHFGSVRGRVVNG